MDKRTDVWTGRTFETHFIRSTQKLRHQFETPKPTNLEESKVLVEVDLRGDDGIALTPGHACHVHLVVEEVHHCVLLSTTARSVRYAVCQPPKHR